MGPGRVSKGLGGWGLDGSGAGGTRRTFARSFVCSYGWTEIPPSVLKDIISFGSAAQKGEKEKEKGDGEGEEGEDGRRKKGE